MKILRLSLIALVLMTGVLSAKAQKQTRKEKEASKAAEVKKMLDTQDFTFTAQQMNPMSGGSVNLTSTYDVRVVKDSLISFLPYFGRAYVAPMNPTDNAMQFTSTKFSYVVTAKKNGNSDVVIKPDDNKDIRQLTFSISPSGYATLSVISINRQAISFYGYLEANKKPDEKK